MQSTPVLTTVLMVMVAVTGISGEGEVAARGQHPEDDPAAHQERLDDPPAPMVDQTPLKGTLVPTVVERNGYIHV